jgi:hypothetical protein
VTDAKSANVNRKTALHPSLVCEIFQIDGQNAAQNLLIDACHICTKRVHETRWDRAKQMVDLRQEAEPKQQHPTLQVWLVYELLLHISKRRDMSLE